VSLSEKCGVFGASVEGEVFPTLYWGMLAQNHRGHQSHGFAAWDGDIDCYTQLGLIPPNQGYGFNIKNLRARWG
jgi:glutamine phosphoribosylpyrophosphate amidotransferase